MDLETEVSNEWAWASVPIRAQVVMCLLSFFLFQRVNTWFVCVCVCIVGDAAFSGLYRGHSHS